VSFNNKLTDGDVGLFTNLVKVSVKHKKLTHFIYIRIHTHIHTYICTYVHNSRLLSIIYEVLFIMLSKTSKQVITGVSIGLIATFCELQNKFSLISKKTEWLLYVNVYTTISKSRYCSPKYVKIAELLLLAYIHCGSATTQFLLLV